MEEMSGKTVRPEDIVVFVGSAKEVITIGELRARVERAQVLESYRMAAQSLNPYNLYRSTKS
ncbi:hypothetical protein LCGC14_0897480 [marine sediment metagenome]|uniref:Uncharacterized protein n=1 Tax=marine sediment metagenome TaxID=412755 RepID=A0A0F9PI68_9ZZZZ